MAGFECSVGCIFSLNWNIAKYMGKGLSRWLLFTFFIFAFYILSIFGTPLAFLQPNKLFEVFHKFIPS